MKINSFLTLAATALVLLSCSKDKGESSLNLGNGRLALLISSSDTRSRAVDDTQANGTTIQSLVVRTLDAAGQQLGSDVTLTSTQLVNIMKPTSDVALKDPSRIVEQIDQLSTQIEVRGYNSTTPATWQEKSVLDVASITTLQLGAMSFADIPFISTSTDGRNAITKTGEVGTGIHEGHKIWTVELDVKPYFARLEVSGTPTEKNSAATFVLKSIYVNNIALTKGAQNTMYKGNGGIWTTDSNGKITGTNGDMDPAYKTTLANMFNETLTDYTTNKKVDAYTLWGQTGMLHVILKIEVTPINGDPAYTGFVTLKNITGASNIEIGKIHKLNLGSLALDYTKDVDPQPYDEGADLYMALTVHPWTEVTLTPGL